MTLNRRMPTYAASRTAVVGLCILAFPVHAADNTASNLPSLALAPPPTASSPSIWSGLYVGSEVFAISGHTKGHVGGGVEIGYNHEFANRIVVGIHTLSGYAPGLFAHGPVRGFDFNATDIRVGYDMGRWMPYVSTGAVLAKPVTGPRANYVSGSQSADDLFSAPGRLRAAPTVGAGVDYALTPNLHVDVGVSAGNNLDSPFP